MIFQSGNQITLFIIIGTLIATLPLVLYIAFFDKKDNGAWLGLFGVQIIKFIRRNK